MTRAAARIAEDPVGALVVAAAALVGLALLGPSGRVVAAGGLLGVGALTLARTLEVAWRDRARTAGPMVLFAVAAWVAIDYLKPGFNGDSYGWNQMLGDEAITRQQVAFVTRACLLLSGPVLVFAGTHRLAGWRRASAGSPWRSLVGAPATDDGRAAARRGAVLAVVGIAVVLGALAEVGYEEATDPYGAQGSFTVAVLGFGVFAGIVAPLLAALLVVGRRDRVERELAVHRQAVAAHLHDSVLQTFALIQRNLDDPERIRRLVRTQERELRAWLAGREVDALEATLSGALRAIADLVEEEHGVQVELDVLADPQVLAHHRPLLDAAREALRNAARHGEGAAIRVLAETVASPVPATVVYVRDDGPGFDPAAVAPQRRGVRDSIVGRMRGAGGSARIDTAPGAGTEVVLTLPDPETRRTR